MKVKGPDGYLYEPVWLNPKEAASRGIAHGDIVKIFNERGTVLGGAYVTQRLRSGVAYMDHENMLQALRVFEKANQLQPKNTKVLVNMGIASDALGHPDLAQGYYTRALAIAPDDTLASCRMASSKYSEGKYDEAMNMWRDIIAKNPRAYCAYFTMGVAFADAGIYRDAIRMWKKVVDLAPDSPEAVSAKESIDVLEKFLAGK